MVNMLETVSFAINWYLAMDISNDKIVMKDLLEERDD